MATSTQSSTVRNTPYLGAIVGIFQCVYVLFMKNSGKWLNMIGMKNYPLSTPCLCPALGASITVPCKYSASPSFVPCVCSNRKIDRSFPSSPLRIVAPFQRWLPVGPFSFLGFISKFLSVTWRPPYLRELPVNTGLHQRFAAIKLVRDLAIRKAFIVHIQNMFRVYSWDFARASFRDTMPGKSAVNGSTGYTKTPGNTRSRFALDIPFTDHLLLFASKRFIHF